MPIINTTDDLLELLRENREFREVVRQAILTEELLGLPAVFDSFSAWVRSELSEVRGELSEVRGQLRQHSNDIGELKGFGLETKLHNRGTSLIATLLKVRDNQRVRVAETDDNSAEFNRAIYSALEDNTLTEEEYERILDTDMIVSSSRPGFPGPVYSAIEASYSISRQDISKVKQSAKILSKVFHEAEIHAAIYYMNITSAIMEEASQQEVHLLRARSLLN